MSERAPSPDLPVRIRSGDVDLAGNMVVPEGATGVALFAHGSGSSRLSPRNRYVARVIQKAGIATLLMDLLMAQEEDEDAYTGEYRFNIPLLAERLIIATEWLEEQDAAKGLKIGYFGASTGAAAALIAASQRPTEIAAVVSRGGRPDLAGDALPDVKAPTLLIVGGEDDVVIDLNRRAAEQLRCPHEVIIVPGATHLFEEPGTLEQVARHATEWFARHIGARVDAGKHT